MVLFPVMKTLLGFLLALPVLLVLICISLLFIPIDLMRWNMPDEKKRPILPQSVLDVTL